MGAAVGARLVQNGLTVLTSLAGRSEASAKRAGAAGLKAASDAEIATTDIILSIVPPGDALALAERLYPVLREANRKPVYVDCNAVSPETVARIAKVIADAGCPFVDAGIIGGPPRTGYDGPRIMVSGADAGRAGALNEFGLRVVTTEGGIGAASALKMCYGGLNKGITALGAAMALAAERAGVGEAFRAELALSQGNVLTQLNRGVPDMFPKAYRWVAEMEEISHFVGPRPEAKIFEGFAGLYERLAQDVGGGKDEITSLGAFFSNPGATQKK
jgi:3-hydroxyisobutyrate dehydrogenase-like beta-hydroxyacid dehydrogenase